MRKKQKNENKTWRNTDTNNGLSEHIDENETALKDVFMNCSDLYMRKIIIAKSFPGLIVYIQGLADIEHIETALLKPLAAMKSFSDATASALVTWMNKELFSIVQAEMVVERKDVIQRIMLGEVMILVDGTKEAIAVNVENQQLNRQPEEPLSESLIRGARVGFIEDVKVNVVLIRRRVRMPELKVEKFLIGKLSNTSVILMYIEHLSSDKVVKEIKKRLESIDVDIVLESGNIEELISDSRYSPFPLMQTTERPDTAAALLMEGKSCILVDGSPMAMVAPVTFWQGFQTMEDYNTFFLFASATRWLRYLFAAIALLLPSFYVAVANFHQEMIPTALALSIAAARELVPFPTMVEALMMEIAFEGLREAGIRLPTPIGPTISIVGALVIGEAAVQAGIISAPVVIVVALTGIASFLIPKLNMSNALRLMRFPVTLFAGLFGLYGVVVALLAILIHLVNLRSFGMPYMSPAAPFQSSGLLDVFIKAPTWILYKRKRKTGVENS
ncbi:spore germination protein KA [Evansella caseinilytica]|uniref:Spore germination protein KA n=1 Tax=Evansella caseinilytica TaxID=1503961 RepID=A0A1H3GMD3_9BACI|nr:spore germination protein [Evansella caseinilytica]SDY04466.1 spore germination protein KA [Evansella caseinilytica]